MRSQQRIVEFDPQSMSGADIEMAYVAQRRIIQALDHSTGAQITLTTDIGQHLTVAVPPAALKLIAQVLGAVSEGRSVSIITSASELSTVEAANFLNVSRPFLIKEIEAGRLKHRMVGTHRRVEFSDLLTYAKEMRQHQEQALDRMANNAREMGLSY